jgi:hypothetical protein
MATLLVDTPPAGEPDPPVAEAASAPEPAPGPPAQHPAPVGERLCPTCSAPLAGEQDWCLECGSGAPGRTIGSGWRPAATILVATLVLVLGAGAAAYAALSKHAPARRVMTTTVAAVTPPVTAPAPTPTPITPETTAVKPPKIPLTTSTPTPTSTEETTAEKEAAAEKEKASKKKNTGGASSEPKPTPILLDTNAAKTYNPYNYAAATFGDPSLAIDGDTSTGWTALINPETSPLLAEGLLINLNNAQKLGSLELVSSSVGMTVQVYGANGATVPASITDPAWVTLSHSVVTKKHHTKIKLLRPKKGFVFGLVWISKAGPASLGTTTSPGHVSINEVELFAPKSAG